MHRFCFRLKERYFSGRFLDKHGAIDRLPQCQVHRLQEFLQINQVQENFSALARLDGLL